MGLAQKSSFLLKKSTKNSISQQVSVNKTKQKLILDKTKEKKKIETDRNLFRKFTFEKY